MSDTNAEPVKIGAFDEGHAEWSIESQGDYRFEAGSIYPIAERPISMP